MEKENIKIGWADADITPEGTVELYGQYYQRVSKGIHSRLGLTVMAAESDSGEQIVMISMDSLGIPFEFLRSARERVRKTIPGIIPEKIIMNATHVHNAPALFTRENWWESAKGTVKTSDYRESVISRIVDAVSRAWESRRLALMSMTRGYAVTGHCRRAMFDGNTAEMYGDTSRDDFIGLEGNEDSTLELLFTYDERKNSTGVIVNVACPSQVMEATCLISSDFMGETRRLLKDHFGEKFHILCQVSSAGDQSPRDLVRNQNADFWNEKGVTILGKRICDAIINEYEKTGAGDISGDLEFSHNVARIKLPKWFPSYRQVLKAEKELKELKTVMSEKEAFAAFTDEVKRNEKIAERPGPYDSKLHHFVLMKNAEAVIQRGFERDKLPCIEMEMHVLRMGNAVFCTNAFELFLDYGLRMKACSKAPQTFIVQLCCGSESYLPTEKAQLHGGYGGLINNSIVGAEGGDILVEETLKIINGSLFADS